MTELQRTPREIDALDGMTQLNPGDRVRVTTGWHFGKHGTIDMKDRRGILVCLDDGGKCWLYRSDVEPAASEKTDSTN